MNNYRKYGCLACATDTDILKGMLPWSSMEMFNSMPECCQDKIIKMQLEINPRKIGTGVMVKFTNGETIIFPDAFTWNIIDNAVILFSGSEEDADKIATVNFDNTLCIAHMRICNERD